jgi:tol-pal system protein YbgF
VVQESTGLLAGVPVKALLGMSTVFRKEDKEGRLPGLRLSGVLILVMLSLSGCLTRTAGPTLPYVKPAQMIPPSDPGPVHLAARVEQMEIEIQRLRDMIERAQAGGNDRLVRNLQERVGAIEKQLGLEPPREPIAPVGPPAPPVEPRMQPPMPGAQAPGARAPVSPPPPVARTNVGAPVEIRNDPIAPDEKAFRDAYQSYRNGAFDPAVGQFEDFLKKNPKSPLASDAVYWIGEAKLAQGRFDEAVLQFDKVIKEFPGSKKELDALLKQGEAFEGMGDAKSARIIYRRLTGDYPHTAQGRIAGSKLKQLSRED